MPTEPPRPPLPPIPVRAVSAGQPLTVYVHPAEVGGHVVCVGLDLRADDDGAITTATVRGLRTAEVIESALAQGRDILKVLVEGMPDEQEVTPDLLVEAFRHVGVMEYAGEPSLPAYRPAQDAGVEAYFAPRRRRGPTPLLDDDALRRIVAPAYRTGGSRPVQAVRAALLDSGVLGDRVSREQAGKAVASARARGFIPPAAGPGRPRRVERSEGES